VSLKEYSDTDGWSYGYTTPDVWPDGVDPDPDDDFYGIHRPCGRLQMNDGIPVEASPWSSRPPI
jgi:hypothetical protein